VSRKTKKAETFGNAASNTLFTALCGEHGYGRVRIAAEPVLDDAPAGFGDRFPCRVLWWQSGRSFQLISCRSADAPTRREYDEAVYLKQDGDVGASVAVPFDCADEVTLIAWLLGDA
jgi:hypothetical protein